MNLRLYNARLDSFKLRLPLGLVEVIDKSLLNSKYLIDLDDFIESGLYEQEFKNKAKKFEINGITTRIAVEEQKIDFKENTERYLTIGINSKQLEGSYLAGIGKDNIIVIYDYLIAFNCIKISFKDFIGCSQVTDMDIKIDFQQTKDEYNTLTKYLEANTKPSRHQKEGCLPFPAPKNTGIKWTGLSWSYREIGGNKAQSKPFFKIYHKEFELDNKSFQFSSKYLNPDEYKNLIRLETTIKNKRHFKYLGIKDNNFSTILNLSQEQLKKAFYISFTKHLIKTKTMEPKKTYTGPTPEELMKIKMLNYFAETSGYDVYMSAEYLIEDIQCKTTRYRKKQQYIELYEKYIKGTKKDTGTNTSKILRFIGWM